MKSTYQSSMPSLSDVSAGSENYVSSCVLTLVSAIIRIFHPCKFDSVSDILVMSSLLLLNIIFSTSTLFVTVVSNFRSEKGATPTSRKLG